MKRLLSLSLLLLSVGASAQTTSLLPQLSFHRVDDLTSDTYTFGSGQCNDTLTVRWQNTLTINLTQCGQNPLKVWATTGECLDTPGTDDKRYDDIPALSVQAIKQGTFTVLISELPGFNASASDGGLTVCGGTTPVSKPHKICGNIEYGVASGFGCSTTQKLAATPLKLVYDTLPPNPPTITEFAAQDEGVRVTFTVPSDATTITVEAKGPSDADYRQLAETASTNTVIHGKGLQNGESYDVRLRAIDGAGNVSDPSSSVTVVPIKTLGFFGYYKQQGGTDTGGCTTGLGLWPALIGIWALRRARKQKARSTI